MSVEETHRKPSADSVAVNKESKEVINGENDQEESKLPLSQPVAQETNVAAELNEEKKVPTEPSAQHSQELDQLTRSKSSKGVEPWTNMQSAAASEEMPLADHLVVSSHASPLRNGRPKVVVNVNRSRDTAKSKRLESDTASRKSPS